MQPAEQEAIVHMVPNAAPCCSVSLAQFRRLPRKHDIGSADALAQRRFEQACARDLLGDID